MKIDNLDYTITKASNTEFVLSFKGANYLVGEIIYILMTGLKSGEDTDSITQKIKKNKNYKDITINDVQTLLKNKIYPLINK